MPKTYKDLLEELVKWETKELMEQYSVEELKGLKKKFESHRQKLITALDRLERKAQM